MEVAVVSVTVKLMGGGRKGTAWNVTMRSYNYVKKTFFIKFTHEWRYWSMSVLIECQ